MSKKRADRSEKTWSITQICDSIESKDIIFTNPVQRGLVWDKDRKGLFIRSVLLDKGIPSASARKIKNAENKYVFDVWEGKQRMTSVYEYKKGSYPIEISNPFFSTIITLKDGTEYDFAGKYYSELPPELQKAFDAYTLSVNYYENMSDEEVAEAYYLENNGKAHTPTDHIWALAKARKEMFELLNHPLFEAALTPLAIEKFTHRTIVMQGFTLYKSPIKSLEAKDMGPFLITTAMNENDLNALKGVFDRMLGAYNILLSSWTKTKAKKMLKKLHMISLIPITLKSIADKRSLEEYTEWVRYFFDAEKGKTSISKEYNTASLSSTNKQDSIDKRLRAIEKVYTDYFERLDAISASAKETRTVSGKTTKAQTKRTATKKENVNEKVTDAVVNDTIIKTEAV